MSGICSHPLLRRLPILPELLAPSFWPLPALPGLARTLSGGGRPPSRLEATVDPAISPGDDFFGYSNGAWLKAAVIPAGKDRWSVRDEINALTRRQLAVIFDDAASAPTGS